MRSITHVSPLNILGAGLAALPLLAGCNNGGQETPKENTTVVQTTGGTTTGGANAPAAGANAATTGSAGGKTFLIGMSQPNKGEPWRQAMNDQTAAAAATHPELKVVFADAQQNNTKQVADVENFISQGIDLLIISPNEAAPLTDVVGKAYDKGIPVIVLDRKVNGDKYTLWIGADNKKIGAMAGGAVAKWCTDQKLKPCNVLELRGLEGSTPAKERGDGFRDGIKANPAVKIVASQNADWLREKAIPVSQSMLQAHPEANVIYGHNDPMAEAGIISAQGANKDLNKLFVVGIDGLPTPDGGIKSVMQGRLDETFVYPTGGKEAIDWAVRILEKKEKPPKSVTLDTEEVSKANAAAVYKKYGGK